ncbi:Flp pilus assembly complex ATPase component TadA [Candidatus Woesearchaeota archaeon]|nr:Flp pilus assembly complex ATPase component TadA [Candidatus Woesearchaeota archaeon]
MGEKLIINKYFDKDTMSVHLKEGTRPLAKRGKPGSYSLQKISSSTLTNNLLESISKEINEFAQNKQDSFIEIQNEKSTIAQIGKTRIVITSPPVSDTWEITAVRPIKKLSLTDYELENKLKERVLKKAEGILVAGAPGEGKTTFVQALAEEYLKQNKIIKTIEAPRDLDVPKSITRYALTHVKPEELKNILLLSRPDYTVFDEMRNTDDFKLYSDLRLSGVGMLGVVHANLPIDAISRFIGRLDLGVIPHVIDTVIFIKAGKIKKVFELAMEVKVPYGMKTSDLARPIISVRDFETKTSEFEIYTYGDQTMVVEVKVEEESIGGIRKIVEEKIVEIVSRYSEDAKAELIDFSTAKIIIPRKDVSRVVGKDKETLKKIGQELGLNLKIEAASLEEEKKEKTPVDFKVGFSEKFIQLDVGTKKTGEQIEVYSEDEYLLAAKVGKNGVVKVRADSDIGKEIKQGIKKGKINICF